MFTMKTRNLFLQLGVKELRSHIKIGYHQEEVGEGEENVYFHLICGTYTR